MHRRSFLSGLAGAAAAAQGRIRIGFLGTSHSHARAKIDIVSKSDRWELAGTSPPLAADQLLADATVQVIAVESEVKDHAEHARMALEAGKHVHLEKPPADTLDRLRRLLDLARQKQRLLQTGYMWRHHPGINAALDAARQGRLGEVFLIRGTINTLIAPAGRAELARFKGGQMFELGCHLIEPVVRLWGRPSRVTSVLRHHGPYRDALADNTVAILEYPKALAIISTASMQPGAGVHRAFEVVGTKGTAVVSPLEPPELAIDQKKIPLPEYRRYVDEFAALADAVAGIRPLGIDPELEYLVQETLLRASEMTS